MYGAAGTTVACTEWRVSLYGGVVNMQTESPAGIVQSVESVEVSCFHQCLHRYVEEISSVAMLATKRSAGVTPKVNLRE